VAEPGNIVMSALAEGIYDFLADNPAANAGRHRTQPDCAWRFCTIVA
jgi:hypothetical protein